MKTLYVSDLDGTLLNPQAELSPSTAEKLNQLIHQGLSFSAATARTWETVQYLLQDVQLSLPLVLMNGVCLFDPVEKNYLHVSTITREPLERMFRAMEQAGVHGFLYQIQGKRMIVSYEAIDHAAMEEFMEERRRKYNKQFVQTESFRKTAKDDVVYLSLLNKKEKLDPVYEAIGGDPELHIEYYEDIYTPGLRYLEVSAGGTSKAASVRWLKEHFGFDRLVVFGDNRNDLPMFDVADESYAVENAVEDVKAAADGVIGANTKDGVPEYLKERLQNGLL